MATKDEPKIVKASDPPLKTHEAAAPVVTECMAVAPGQTCLKCGYNSDDVKFRDACHPRA